MAQISSAILNDALENWARTLCNDSPGGPSSYAGMGVGESDVAAAATQHDLQGVETHYNDVTGSYLANYQSKWQSAFNYDDLASHIFKELVICESAASHLNRCLCRITCDTITLLTGESVTLTVTNTVQQGT